MSILVALGMVAVVAVGAWIDLRNNKARQDTRHWGQLTEGERLVRTLRRVK